MIKYASNALLATLISFSNELANLGAAIGGIDTVEVMRGVHLSQYFRGRNKEGLPPITAFLAAGCGFGGSCLPKDVSALIAHGRGGRQPDAAARVGDSDQSGAAAADGRAAPEALAESRGPEGGGARAVVQARDERRPREPGVPDHARAGGRRAPWSRPTIRWRCTRRGSSFPSRRCGTARRWRRPSTTSMPSSSSRPGRSSAISRRRLNGEQRRVVFVDGRRAFDKGSVPAVRRHRSVALDGVHRDQAQGRVPRTPQANRGSPRILRPGLVPRRVRAARAESEHAAAQRRLQPCEGHRARHALPGGAARRKRSSCAALAAPSST